VHDGRVWRERVQRIDHEGNGSYSTSRTRLGDETRDNFGIQPTAFGRG
jgi:hypothetical protein